MTDSADRDDVFYIKSTSAWRRLADLHLEDGGVAGALARALDTLIDAYEHAHSDGTTGAKMIAAERQRQIEAEGWTPEHDDKHVRYELAWAASCYAAPETVYRVRVDPERGVTWEEPWPTEIGSARGNPYPFPWRRPECDRMTQLVKAGALIAAEIDRLQRAAMSTAEEDRLRRWPQDRPSQRSES